MLQFEAQRVDVAFHGMLARGIDAENGRGNVGGNGSSRDQCATTVPHVLQCLGAAVNNAPVVGPEDPLVVFVCCIREGCVNSDACVVDPGIETAVPADDSVDYVPHLVAYADISNHIIDTASLFPQIFADALQRVLIARYEHNVGSVFRRLLRCREAYAGTGTHDDDGLFVQWLELSHRSPRMVGAAGVTAGANSA